MVTGVPCMCMSTTGTPCSAQRGSSAGSKRPAETSFTTSAPSSSARRTIVALEVSTEIGTRTAARTARSTGRRRRRSSSAGTGGAPGRVDSAPTPSIAAPSATISAAAAAARPGSRWRPPSEKESEVAAQEELGALVGLEQDAAHLGVDLDGGLLGVVDLLREVAAEEYLLFLLAEGHRPELVAHAPLAHHLARQLGGALDVVARPRR